MSAQAATKSEETKNDIPSETTDEVKKVEKEVSSPPATQPGKKRRKLNDGSSKKADEPTGFLASLGNFFSGTWFWPSSAPKKADEKEPEKPTKADDESSKPTDSSSSKKDEESAKPTTNGEKSTPNKESKDSAFVTDSDDNDTSDKDASSDKADSKETKPSSPKKKSPTKSKSSAKVGSKKRRLS